jgi:hypothetical protein
MTRSWYGAAEISRRFGRAIQWVVNGPGRHAPAASSR